MARRSEQQRPWTLLWLLVLTTVKSTQQATEDDGASSLRLVQVLYRHGDRTPTHPFPTDEWKDSWSEGLGQLTNVGKTQQYGLGQFLRRRYDHFLTSTYNKTEITIHSTDVDRTLMSAYCNLAGLYPPGKDQRWDANLDWQPIPVHTRPVAEDYVLSFDAVCPRYNELMAEVKNSPEAKTFDEEHKELYIMIGNYTGADVSNLFDISDIYDTLYIEKLKNKTTPSWLSDSLYEALDECDKKDFFLSFKTDELCRLRGGFLVKEMIQHMQDKLDGKNESQKAFIYSAHDMTIVAFLSSLHLYNNVQPPYASAVIVELHESNGNRSVKILYRNTTDVEPYELHVPNCSSPCSFEKFLQLTSNVVPKDVKECQASSSATNLALIGAIVGSILGCAFFLLIAAAYALYHRKATQYQYINIRADM